eukprot:gene4348-6732_t
MLHYIRYGIRLGLVEHVISPFGPSSFKYSVGNVHLNYSMPEVRMRLPGGPTRTFTIEKLTPNATYTFGATECDKAFTNQTLANGVGRISFVSPTTDGTNQFGMYHPRMDAHTCVDDLVARKARSVCGASLFWRTGQRGEDWSWLEENPQRHDVTYRRLLSPTVSSRS